MFEQNELLVISDYVAKPWSAFSVFLAFLVVLDAVNLSFVPTISS